MERLPKRAGGSTGRYLYALVPGGQNLNYESLGINGTRVYTIAEPDLAAVVSDVPNQKIRPERRHFAAHQAVLKKLAQDDGAVLPMSFGMISNGSKAVRQILSRNRKAVIEQLRLVSGKVEMGLRRCLGCAQYIRIPGKYAPRTETARDRLVRSDRIPTHDEKIEIGRLFETILTSDRDLHAAKVEEALAGQCYAIKRNKCREEREAMNLVCLVGRNDIKKFESGVFEAASLFDDNFSFDYNGPWAPHNFVEIDINL